MHRLRVLLGIVGLAVALAACGGASEGSGEGVVRGVDREAARVTIEHGEIPGIMKAMTMTFDVSSPELLRGVETGDAIAFDLRYEDGAYTVTGIRER